VHSVSAHRVPGPADSPPTLAHSTGTLSKQKPSSRQQAWQSSVGGAKLSDRVVKDLLAPDGLDAVTVTTLRMEFAPE
jgi:hypothetical protein